jgi:hypothetical protein
VSSICGIPVLGCLPSWWHHNAIFVASVCTLSFAVCLDVSHSHGQAANSTHTTSAKQELAMSPLHKVKSAKTTPSTRCLIRITTSSQFANPPIKSVFEVLSLTSILKLLLWSTPRPSIVLHSYHETVLNLQIVSLYNQNTPILAYFPYF